MRSRIALLLAVAALAGCRAGDSTRPEYLNGSPSFLIADATHSNGNPDFFFLPPMAPDPTGSAKFDAGAFNANLKPTVKICALAGTTAPGGDCSSYLVQANINAPSGEAYHYNWSVPNAAQVFYRIEVWVDETRLGYADVQTSDRPQDLKNVDANALVTAKDGSTLPIKFRVERYALPCDAPGAGPLCTSKTVNLLAGGTVHTDIGGDDAGVIIKPGSGATTHTITVKSCADLNPRVTDLKTFGPCISVTATPALPPAGLIQAATVYICAVIPEVEALGGEQHDRVTMHKYDPGVLMALPHAQACGAPPTTLTSLLGALKRGSFKKAAAQAVAMLAPKVLNAAPRRLDVGAGGEALDFSDFQFALPSKFTIVAGNNQTLPSGSVLAVAPKVQVTDLGGDPVVGARVRFASSPAACAALAAGAGTESGTGGFVESAATWTVAAGSNTIAVACGRGIAGSDNNGPRPGEDDPFQPISHHFDESASDGPAVTVLTGSVAFNATGVAFTYGTELVGRADNAYTTYGPYAGNSGPELLPSAWSSLAGSAGSQAPFRENTSGCGAAGPIASSFTFSLGADLYLKRTVVLPVDGKLVATMWIDNDLRVWVGDDEKTATIPTGLNSSYAAPWWKHENCVNDGNAVLTVPLKAGTYTLGIRARDRGGNAYFDMKVVLNAPTP